MRWVRNGAPQTGVCVMALRQCRAPQTPCTYEQMHKMCRKRCTFAVAVNRLRVQQRRVTMLAPLATQTPFTVLAAAAAAAAAITTTIGRLLQQSHF